MTCAAESKGRHIRCGVRYAVSRREAVADRGGKHRAGAGLDCRLGAGHGEERTPNIHFMSMTLDVSKFSGWLNADARCHE